MSKTAYEQVLEKFSIAVVGEEPAVVITVLAAFSRECCDRYGITVDDFVAAVRGANLGVRS